MTLVKDCNFYDLEDENHNWYSLDKIYEKCSKCNRSRESKPSKDLIL